jgi:hypothetical protein
MNPGELAGLITDWLVPIANGSISTAWLLRVACHPAQPAKRGSNTAATTTRRRMGNLRTCKAVGILEGGERVNPTSRLSLNQQIKRGAGTRGFIVTPEREAKRVERLLRTIPVEAIAPDIAASESVRDGLWCLVAGEVSFVPIHGGGTTTSWCDPLAYAQHARWLRAHPERVHDTQESAVAFVRAQLGGVRHVE